MSAQVTITQLPAAGAITGTESVPIVQNGQTVRTTTGAIAASPSQTQTFITVNQEPTLANSRYLGATNGLTLSASSPQGVLNITTTGALLSLISSGTGLQVKTDATTLTGRTISTGTAGISVSNGDGVSGNPTISLTGQVLNFANASVNGIVTLTTGGTVSSTQIQGTANQIDVANGNGVSGSPTIGIATNPTLPGAAGVLLPSGSSGDRSVAPTNGTLRYNTDFTVLEAYLNNAWTTLASGSGVTSIATGTGLSGGPITSTGTIFLANTAVTAGSYTAANITVNAQGQITAASSNASLVSSFSGGSTGLTPATATTGAITLAGVLVPANGGTGAATLTGYVYGNGTGTMTASTTIPTTALSGTVTNAQLANSTITLGSTSISLGGSTLAPIGLTSVTVTQDPTTAFQLATKQYVDTQVSTGLTYHQPVQAATTAALTGVVTYNNGTAGVGATLTLGTALTVLDGYTLVNTDRVLIKNQADQIQNGVYTWATGGTVLTRATDADTYGSGVNNLSLNDYFFVQNGTVNKGISYVLSSPAGTITFGTSNIVFSEFSTSQVYTGTSPINISGTVISLNTVPATSGGTGTATVTTGDLLYGSAADTWSKLGIGTNGYILTVSGGVPTWSAAPATGVTSFSAGSTGLTPNTATTGAVTLAGTLAIANGGTNGTATPTAGGSAYGTGTAYAFTAAGTAGQVLTSAGASAPVWSGISGGTF